MEIDHAVTARARARACVRHVHRSVIDCSSPQATWPPSLIGEKVVGTGALVTESVTGLFDSFWTPGLRDTSEAGSSCVAVGAVGVGLDGFGSSGLGGAAPPPYESPELGAGRSAYIAHGVR